jgi:hypothetical protein
VRTGGGTLLLDTGGALLSGNSVRLPPFGAAILR